jgi:gluconokinase
MLPIQVVVMGVAGSGKSRVGSLLAQALDLPFVEGDGLHTPNNVARMAAGVALTDEDRAGWLHQIGQCLIEHAGTGVVVSCSALKRSYRDGLRRAAPALRLVYLRGEPRLLAERIAARADHFMPPALLQSQLDTLEPPGTDEGALEVDIAAPPQVLAQSLAKALRTTPSSRP